MQINNIIQRLWGAHKEMSRGEKGRINVPKWGMQVYNIDSQEINVRTWRENEWLWDWKKLEGEYAYNAKILTFGSKRPISSKNIIIKHFK